MYPDAVRWPKSKLSENKMTEHTTDLTELAHEHMQSIPKGAAHAAHLETLSSPWRESDLNIGALLDRISDSIADVGSELVALTDDISHLETSRLHMEERLDDLRAEYDELLNKLSSIIDVTSE